MRKDLSTHVGETVHDISGRFRRFGYKGNSNLNRLAILLDDININDEIKTGHSWISVANDALENIEIHKHDVIVFDAVVEQYTKRNGIETYGFSNISNIRIKHRSGEPEATLEDVSHMFFKANSSTSVWKGIKGNKQLFLHDENREVQRDVCISADDTIELELKEIKTNGQMVYVWHVVGQDRWNSDAVINPLIGGQSVTLYHNYKLFLPDDLYFLIKDFFFRIFFSKSEITIPFKREMIYYKKPEKFKHRYFLNYDEFDNEEEPEIIQKKKYVYENLQQVVDNISDELIIQMTKEVFDNIHSLAVFTNPASPHYLDNAYIKEKIINVFTSAVPATKSKFLKFLVMNVSLERCEQYVNS